MKKDKLGSIISVKHGYAFKSENYVDSSNTVLVTLANFSESNNFKFNFDKSTFYGSDYPKEYNLFEGDLVVPLTEQVIGLFGNTAFVPKIDKFQFVLNQRVGKVEPKNNVDLNYVHYLMSTKSVRDQLESKASSGTKQRNISPEDIYNVEILLQDYKEQVKIGECLYQFERIINNNNRLNEMLDKTIKNIYEHWFLQFDFPNDKGFPYKSSGGEMIYSKVLKREIPKEWKIDKLGSNTLCEIIKPGVDSFENKNYLATRNVNCNSILDGEWVTYENRPERAKMQPIKNSVWFAKMKNSTKHITVTNQDQWFIDKYILSTGFLGLKCNKASLAYIHSLINTDYFEKIKDKISHGATQQSVNNNDLMFVNIVIPPNEILGSYRNLVYPMISEINKNFKVNQELKKIQDFLLPILMNNQISIS